MDKLTRIKSLLDKFYKGDTSIAEEKELEEYFIHQEVPDELAAEKELFSSFSAGAAPVDVPDDLENKILTSLDKAERSVVRSRRINIYSISGLAAGLLILFSIYMGFLRDNSFRSVSQYAIEDPDLAYEEAKSALEYVSYKLNSGTAELTNLKEVNKGLKTISSIKKISSGSREINLLGNLKKAENIQRQ